MFQAENRQREAVTEAQAEVAMLRKQIKDLNLKVSEVDGLNKRIKEKEVKKLFKNYTRGLFINYVNSS